MRRALGALLLMGTLGACTNPAPVSEHPDRTRTTTTAGTLDPSQAGRGAASDFSSTCPSGVEVTTAAELTAALAAAEPGSVIQLADGIYPGRFVAAASGTAAQPIWLCGSEGAVIDGGDIKSGYSFHLNQAQYWRLSGFSVRGGQKGVVADHASHCVIVGLQVSDIGDEAIHLRSATTDCVVKGNVIARTGLHNKKFGEGIYVGSARSNWSTYGTDGGPDRSDRNLVISNRISSTSAEAVDIKEGTTAGVLQDNTFEGRGMTGADSWVDLKGNDWLIQGNHGTDSPTDGFQVHTILDGWGQGNVFQDNTGPVGGSGYGINLAGAPDNIVFCSNTFTAAGEGQSNTQCR